MRVLIFVFVCFASAVAIQPAVVAAQGNGDFQARAYYFEAEKALSEKRFDQAFQLLKKAEQTLGATNALLSLLEVKILIGQKKYIKADEALAKFYSFNPNDRLQREISSHVVRLPELIKSERQKLTIEKGNAQVRVLLDKVQGGFENDSFNDIISLNDGNLLLFGETESKGEGNYDGWFVKVNTNGDVHWDKTHGSVSWDKFLSASSFFDGSFVLAGRGRPESRGEFGSLLVKLDRQGNLLWDRNISSGGFDDLRSIISLPDGNILLAGREKPKAIKSDSGDGLLVKLDSEGNLLWKKNYGGIRVDVFEDLVLSNNGAMLLSGGSKSDGAGSGDGWLIKLDHRGDLVWEKRFGGFENDFFKDSLILPDGSLLLVGATQSTGRGRYDGWLIKVDSSGDVLWDKTYGGGKDDFFRTITQLENGNVLLAGYTDSKGAGGDDGWVIVIDSKGNTLVDRAFGGSKNEYFEGSYQLTDGNIMLVGQTESKGAGEYDGWLMKIRIPVEDNAASAAN